MNCKHCDSEIKRRRIPFGRVGFIELQCCQCEATRLTIKYSNTKAEAEQSDCE